MRAPRQSRRRANRAILALLAAAALGASSPAPAGADFGLTSFDTAFESPAGTPMNIAGSHADVTFSFALNEAEGVPDETLRRVEMGLPPGLSGNPTVTTACSMSELSVAAVCPPSAQVGTIFFESIQDIEIPLYNMVTTSAQTLQLGASAITVPIKVDLEVRTSSDYGLTATLSSLGQGQPIYGAKITLWGVPADPVHDAHRHSSYLETGASSALAPRPFLSLPPACGSVTTTIRVASWQHPEQWDHASSESPPLSGCASAGFEPTVDAHIQTASAGAPSAVAVDVDVPQEEAVGGQGTPPVRSAAITLPKGVALSPGSASGLSSCSDTQLGLGSDAEPSCPDASKLGSASLDTPALRDRMVGDVILGTPRRGQLVRLFLVLRGFGILIKIPGVLQPDLGTGQLVARFEEMPQLPFEKMHLAFKGGPRAAFLTPSACGVYTTHAELTSWAGPGVVPVESSFAIDRGCDRRGRFAPTVEAGTVDPEAGNHSPFAFQLLSQDGEQNVARIEATLPEGVLARLAGIPRCPDPETGSGQCPAASRVGSVTVGAGPGPTPIYLPEAGRPSPAVYLAGPYRGAPYSLVTAVPAQAGPFDLGMITVRSAVQVNPITSRLTISTDPLPQIVEGIPISYRDIRLMLDRRRFVINPTSCDPMQVRAALVSASGTAASASTRFRAVDCERLPFRPQLSVRLSGPTHRSAHPRLRFVLKRPAGDANVARVALMLPSTEYFDSTRIRAVCSRIRFAAGDCPPGSVHGFAKVWSPLLARPLRGPVYLRESDHRLPDVVASLDGEIHLDLVGRIDSARARIRNTFDSVPDVPVSKLAMTLKGGEKGLIVNNTELCRAAPRAAVTIRAHNGKSYAGSPRVRADCESDGDDKRVVAR